MNVKNVSDFFKNELTDFSSYSTLRMLGSAIDSFKNSQRKIIWTALNKLNFHNLILECKNTHSICMVQPQTSYKTWPCLMSDLTTYHF